MRRLRLDEIKKLCRRWLEGNALAGLILQRYELLHPDHIKEILEKMRREAGIRDIYPYGLKYRQICLNIEILETLEEA